MLCTCPECRTTYRIHEAQLDAKRGLVRCGRCKAVFNAYDTLMPEPAARVEAGPLTPQTGIASASSPPAWTADRPDPPRRVDPVASPQAASRPEAEPKAEPMPEAQPERPAEPSREQPAVIADEARSSAEKPRREEQSEGTETPESILLSELPERRATARTWLRMLGGLAAVVLLLLLPLQVIFFLRAELAAWLPQTRPYLEAACEPIGCTVALPHDRAALRVESSALETDPENPDRALLRVVFSNRSGQTVAWPHLVLTLTDLRDTPLARRAFTPREYLPAQDAKQPGLAARHEYEVALELDLNGLAAVGYRVALDYP